MKRYEGRQFYEAIEHAKSGGQALYMHHWIGGADAPRCFQGPQLIGKLFDNDAARLEQTAKLLGVKRVKIDRPGQDGQHVDLVGGPLQRALEKCREAV